MTAAVVLLSGASAVGKTTTAIQLQRALSVPTAYLAKEAVAVSASLDRPREELMELERALLDAYLQALVAYSRAGLIAIGETILLRSDMDRVRAALAPVRAVAIRLTCSLEGLITRERQRSTTFAGTAEASLLGEAKTGFDLTIDTEANSPERVALQIAGLLGLD